MRAALADAADRHDPVLIRQVLEALAPERGGVFLDGTFGAGGYARALLDGGAERLLGVDRDPTALARAQRWAPLYQNRLQLLEGCFGELDELADAAGAPALNGVALDIGVSSMQIDEAARGFSFSKDGPLDMRMEGVEGGTSAAELIAEADETQLANIIFHYGEERASRRIARAIIDARNDAPIETTSRLAEIVEAATGGRFAGGKSGRVHPATKTFQALRIAINDEFGELTRGLAAAERALAPDGVLAVVSFHSLEDRIVKRFFADRFGTAKSVSRYQPEFNGDSATFEAIAPFGRKAVVADEAELSRNPRARSAKLRVGRRLDAPARALDPKALGAPSAEAHERGGNRRGGRKR
ncbi:MAG: 16S rRNA (cytosine(1402)-N(4))-methyltransferase RsmH [Neomegalonema sp.]|nr:16S rRNA (cytosine(1402)-N(4))-methyltransferase RsmH [Neomegalonema sp.]